MPVNSKQKGNTFERKIAKSLSERFAAKTGLTDAFRRNIDSGSFFGKTNQTRIETHGTENACFGDLMAPSGFVFSIECKHYKTPPSFNAIMKQDYKQLDEWISQSKQDALNAGKRWLIIIKFNSVEEFVVLDDPDTTGAIISYKGSSFIPLKKFLTRPDDFFFEA